MKNEQITQSLKLTISELMSQLSDEMTSKHLIALELVEKEAEATRLQKENRELFKLLEDETTPEKGGKKDGIITCG